MKRKKKSRKDFNQLTPEELLLAQKNELEEIINLIEQKNKKDNDINFMKNE